MYNGALSDSPPISPKICDTGGSTTVTNSTVAEVTVLLVTDGNGTNTGFRMEVSYIDGK